MCLVRFDILWIYSHKKIQKVRLAPVEKMITLFFIGRCQSDGITQATVFLPPTADFLNGQRPLFYRGSCCRHAAHGVGDGGDDKEENSFSNWRHRRQQKGEADNSRHGFLYLYHPIYYVLLQVTPTANRNSVSFPLRAGDLRFRVAASWELAAIWFVRIKMVGYGQSEYQTCGLTQSKSTLLK